MQCGQSGVVASLILCSLFCVVMAPIMAAWIVPCTYVGGGRWYFCIASCSVFGGLWCSSCSVSS